MRERKGLGGKGRRGRGGEPSRVVEVKALFKTGEPQIIFNISGGKHTRLQNEEVLTKIGDDMCMRQCS